MNLFDRVIRIEFENRDTGEKFFVGNSPESSKGPKTAFNEVNKITFQVEKQISTEPNVAFVEIFNLSDSTRAKINFRQDVRVLKFGNKINIVAGYRGEEKRIFSGVIVAANSPKEGPTFVTRINARNIFYELMSQKIVKTAAKGELRSSFIIKILEDIGATLADGSEQFIKERLGDSKFKDATTYVSSAASVINDINSNLVDRINIYFDDVGVNFNPLGVALDIPVIEYSQKNGLIGTPEINEVGADFKILLDASMKLNSPVKLDSVTIRAINPGMKYVVKKVIHVGSNRADDVFETRCQAIYEILKLQAVS